MGSNQNPDDKQEKTRRRNNSVARKLWLVANKERLRERVKAYRIKNKAHVALLKRNVALKAKYGITHADYIAKLHEQNGCCAICGIPELNAINKRLVVDHNHITGKFRGLLCFRCNTDLGVLENKEFVDNANKYLYIEV